MTFSEFVYFLLASRDFVLTKISPYFPILKGIFFLISVLLLILIIYLETKINFFREKFFYYLRIFGIDTQKIIFRKKIEKLFSGIYNKISVKEKFDEFLKELHQFLDDILKYKGFKGVNLEERIRNFSSRLLSSYYFLLDEKNFYAKANLLSELLVYKIYLEKLALE